MTDEQFERKLDRLLETETLEDANRWRREAHEAANASADVPDRNRDDEQEQERERVRDLEQEQERERVRDLEQEQERGS